MIGRAVRLDGVPHTVIGVMPASFQFPARSVEAWTPLLLREDDYADRNDNYLEVVGRPLTMSVAAILCLATALAGCLRPALRAARVDPLTALRSE